jgi:hypothetical protein
VGQKSFVNEIVGNEIFGKMYNYILRSIVGNVDPQNLNLKIPLHAPIQHDMQFEQFIYEILEYLAKNGRMEDQMWKHWDFEGYFKFQKFRDINYEIGSQLGESENNFTEFSAIYKKNKHLFITEQDNRMLQAVQNFLNSIENNLQEYYSLIISSYKHKSYGLVLNGSIETYFPSDEYVKLNDIPPEIQKNIIGLEIQERDGAECLDGCYSFAFRIPSDKKIELGLVRLMDGNTHRGKEYFIKDDWHLGYLMPEPSMFPGDAFRNYDLYHQMLTDWNSRRLYGRITLKDGKLISYGTLWWNQKELQIKHYLKNRRGLNYGISLVNFLVTRFGNTFRSSRINTEIFSVELADRM